MLRPSSPSILLTTLLLGLTACESTRWPEREPIDTLPAAYQNTGAKPLEIKESLLNLFENNTLTEIVQKALDNNPDLKRARASMEEAGYSYRGARASFLPSLSASANGGYSEAVGGATNETYSASLDSQWEVDIWGRIRSNAAASEADLLASQADYEAARQSLAAQTMQSWFSLVSAAKLLDLDSRRVESFKSTNNLVERRFEVGETTLTDLNLARSDLANAEADLESTRNARDQAARQLQTLIGTYPSSNYNAQTNWPALKRSVAEGLPSDLMLNRPDIEAAFQRLQAADKRFAVARTQIFPTFALTATGGRRSDTLSDLADSAFNSWSALANLSLTLFDGGSRRASINAAEKRTEQAYYAYQQVVLNAFREVENALGSELYLAKEEERRLAALEAAQLSLDRAQRDYETGLITILSLLETQRRVFTTERQTITLHANRLTNRVSLALALGKAK